MRKILLVILASMFAVGSAHADSCSSSSSCSDCSSGLQVYGFMGPNFRMQDMGEDNASNMGFGMAFCRFIFTGAVEGGPIVKKIGWRVESDISEPARQALQWAYLQLGFNEQFSARFGRVKMPFSREILHPTSKLLTVDRHIGSECASRGYGGFAYGLEGLFAHEMFKAQFGVYDGEGAQMHVEDQDPALTMGARVVFMPPVEGLEIGANVIMEQLPNGGSDMGVYVDDDNTSYESNSGMAFGLDVDFQTKVAEEMFLWAQAEFGTGDNWMAGAKDPETGDTWEDYEWYSFQYFYVKALLKVTKDFGFHVGFSQWDPNTDADNDQTTKITPGVVYWWAKKLRTQVEVQLCTDGGGVDPTTGDELDDLDYTSFVLQNIWVWH